MSERYVSPHPLPTPRERELLVILIEECSEVIKDATKWLRFGAKDIDPNKRDGITNDERVALELGDVLCMVNMCADAGLINMLDVDMGRRQKAAKVLRFLQTEDVPHA